jgi:hypothetical protein
MSNNDEISEIDEENFQFLYSTKLLNIFFTLIITVIGLTGHGLTIHIYCIKKRRLTSQSIYLLCLSINDGLFLIVNFFEDTIRSIQSLEINYLSSLIEQLNIIDKYNPTCKFINYLRNVLRFVSAYIIVAFTLKRFLIVFPNNKLKNTQNATWLTCILILAFSLIINLWTPFFFRIQSDESSRLYCDIEKIFKSEYFLILIVYILMIMFIPISVILISNLLILIQAFKADSKLKKNQVPESTELVSVTVSSNKNIKKSQDINKMSKILLLISFTYAFLNLPYFIMWCLFFKEVAFNQNSLIEKNNLFAGVQITEIFFILNYSIHFYINYLSSSRFRRQLKIINKCKI